MVDITITPASVITGSGSVVKHGTAGATITAGKTVYRDGADSKYKLADSNGASATIRGVKGIALNGASDGQPLAVHESGPITIGATLTAGVAYYLSDTPGGICPVADVGAGEYSTVVGIATSVSVLDVDIHESGVSL
ncbi:MAG: hypothetical protein V4696_06680 [Pseudomonadota bacterium]